MSKVSHLPMQLVNDRWLPDFTILEQLAEQADLLLLCNPHNPGEPFLAAQTRANCRYCRNAIISLSAPMKFNDLLLDPQTQHIPFASSSPAAALTQRRFDGPQQNVQHSRAVLLICHHPQCPLRHKLQHAMRGLMADNNLLGFTAAEAAAPRVMTGYNPN